MKRKTYPLRISHDVITAMQRWANDDLRSLNAQIEFVLRDGLTKAGRFTLPNSSGPISEADVEIETKE